MLPFTENSATTDQTLILGLTLAKMLAAHVLVACRLLGLIVTIPGLNGSALPWHLKTILLVVLAAIITPNVSPTQRQQLAELTDQVRTVSHDESDPANSIEIDGRDSEQARSLRASSTLSSGLDFFRLAVCEMCLGLLLGLGACAILQGLRMAGQLIDQQTGWGLISANTLDATDVGTASGELLFWMGTVLLFVLGGHLLLISTLLESFRAFPPGVGQMNVDLVPVVSHLVRQSLSLALQVSAPVIATQVLAGIVLSHASAMAPQFQQSGAGVVLRLVLASLVLLLTLSGLADRMLDVFPGSFVGWAPSPSVL